MLTLPKAWLDRIIVRPRQPGSRRTTCRPEDIEVYLSALQALPASFADDYQLWLQVGMILHGLDPSGRMLDEWDRWSRQSAKYQLGVCGRKWETFSADHTNGVRVGTLIKWAKEAGWKHPNRGESMNRRKREKSSRVNLNGHERLTDLGNAARLVNKHGVDLRYVHPMKKYLVWDGTRFKFDDTGEAKRRAQDVARSIYSEAAEAEDVEKRQALAQWASKSENSNRIGAMLSQSAAFEGVPILPGELDTDPFLLNAINGTIDLRTGKLRSHQRSDLMTKLTRVPFDPNETCPTWEAFLRTAFAGDQDLIDYLWRVMGYWLTGDVREQYLWLFWGTGANGKSTLLSSLLELLGDYGMKAPPKLLMVKKGEAHPTELADLHGRRFVSAIETEDGGRLAEALVKELCGGDKIRARRMREDFWQFDPTHKIVLATNHRPKIRSRGHAIWRRIVLVPFEVRFWDPERGETGPEHLKQDKTLLTKLRSELPGVLAWSVRGCLEWQRSGLGEPDTIKRATNDYREDEDSIGAFIEECCVVGDRSAIRVQVGQLYEAYRDWCGVTGAEAIEKREFNGNIEERGYEKRPGTGGYVWWRRIGLRVEQVD